MTQDSASGAVNVPPSVAPQAAATKRTVGWWRITIGAIIILIGTAIGVFSDIAYANAYQVYYIGIVGLDVEAVRAAIYLGSVGSTMIGVGLVMALLGLRER